MRRSSLGKTPVPSRVPLHARGDAETKDQYARADEQEPGRARDAAALKGLEHGSS